ncbi:hypothetical protein BESB_022790 [Besnoitia besnoiti]|uniref:Uncharacterized protein n=1 Tax=Besnoitia besnoiti TaxID=94643 RepID=A0A2A9M808_BESBE|nr:hypothetical protein BESB_022790 [Besnoitia besnoiti]PFH31787.1 hypothetical protein BESB_022790 [Besnoitia besnoiti]
MMFQRASGVDAPERCHYGVYRQKDSIKHVDKGIPHSPIDRAWCHPTTCAKAFKTASIFVEYHHGGHGHAQSANLSRVYNDSNGLVRHCLPPTLDGHCIISKLPVPAPKSTWCGMVTAGPIQRQRGSRTASFLQLKKGTHPQSFPVPLRGQSSTHVTVLNALRAEPVRAAQDVQKALETLPFVPHIGETEGESEEISVDELPPEAKTLTQESQATVIAITKMQKRPVKLAFAGVFGALLLAHLYFGWIILTFLLNKCMSLDELTGQPEQYADSNAVA